MRNPILLSKIKNVLNFSLILGLSACSGGNNRRYSPPQSLQIQQLQALDNRSFDYNPRVDILFVVDNSNSMDNHQAKLSANMNQFVDKFTANKVLDYHIGVVSVYDTLRFKTFPSKEDEGYKIAFDKFNDYKKTHNSSDPEFYRLDPRYSNIASLDRTQPVLNLGEFRPLKKIKSDSGKDKVTGKSIFESEYVNLNRNYLTRDDKDLTAILGGTIRLGALTQEQGSPIFEESFSPVLAALDPKNPIAANAGFYREDAHLIVIFLTDAEDISEVSSDSLYSFALDLKKGNTEKVTFYGAIVPSGDTYEKNKACIRDGDEFDKNRKLIKPGPSPYKIEAAINSSGGSFFSLCSDLNFGEKLAEIGTVISKKTGTLAIEMPGTIDVERVRVFYGKQEIGVRGYRPTSKPSWESDDKRNLIILTNLEALDSEPGAKITINFVPLNGKNVKTSPVKPAAPTEAEAAKSPTSPSAPAAVAKPVTPAPKAAPAAQKK